MTYKYTSSKRLKCVDCSLYNTEVSYNYSHKVNLCVDCFLSRQIKILKDLDKR
jgi:hypothetical protein